MTPEQTELAGRRLRLGIANVGFWVFIASVGLVWLVSGGAAALAFRWYLLFALGSVGAQAIFDFIGGTLLMPAPRPAATDFLRGWLQGVLGHTLVLTVIGAMSYASFCLSGGFSLGLISATAGLVFSRRYLLRIIGRAASAEFLCHDVRVLTIEVVDPAFTGGIDGFGVRAASLLPAKWTRDLPAEELAIESFRRSWQTEHGLPGRALFLGLGWNLLGASIGTLAFQLAARRPAEALFGYACWMTLWAFGSLLVLPSLSRQGVFAADRASLDAGHDPRGWIARFAGLVGEDGGSNAAVQTIFYPVPSARMRLLHLEKQTAGFVPGNVARSNLYYSWATFTMLGRAVHCNVGRPALWVFPPSA